MASLIVKLPGKVWFALSKSLSPALSFILLACLRVLNALEADKPLLPSLPISLSIK